MSLVKYQCTGFVKDVHTEQKAECDLYWTTCEDGHERQFYLCSNFKGDFFGQPDSRILQILIGLSSHASWREHRGTFEDKAHMKVETIDAHAGNVQRKYYLHSVYNNFGDLIKQTNIYSKKK